MDARQVADGADVVIGLVETHGRKETEALVEGLEVVSGAGPTTKAGRSPR